MRLIDKQNNSEFNDVYLFLTKKEASKIANQLDKILKNEEDFITIFGEDAHRKLTKKITFRILSKE